MKVLSQVFMVSLCAASKTEHRSSRQTLMRDMEHLVKSNFDLKFILKNKFVSLFIATGTKLRE